MTRTLLVLAAVVCAHASPLSAQPATRSAAEPLPEWRQRGVCYEVFVRSFFDSDGDGVGDLRGLIRKLDYINDGDPSTQSDLGATCIWLMPVAQSPSYHGYDVTNYYEINRDYGTNEDFKQLMTEARRRGIHVIVDLVLNHMAAEHPLFRHALIERDSPYRDWFTWAPAPRPSPGWEAPVWHRAWSRDEYYYGLFWSGMPDINLANAEATAKLKDVARFWLEEMGVDGFRIDAVGHFFEGPAGEWKHDPAVHPWLRDYQAHVRRVKPDAFTIGEVWDGIDPIRPYYPDQLDNYFIFEVADGIVNAVRSGAAAPLVAAVVKAQRELPRGRWSPFIRNHDQTRTMTEFRGDAGRAKLAATLLLTLPGFPFLYYGEELGMTGDKPDPRLRTPMHWSLERAAGFTTALPWEPLQPDSFTANVAVQDGDPASLLNHHRRLIRLRAATPALGATGEFIPLATGDEGVLAYLRREGDSVALVLANLTDRRIARLALSSEAGALPAGRYAVRPVLGEAGGGSVQVTADGRIRRWIPVPALEPLQAHVLTLRR
jgi:alpha-amylase